MYKLRHIEYAEKYHLIGGWIFIKEYFTHKYTLKKKDNKLANMKNNIYENVSFYLMPFHFRLHNNVV